MEELKQDFFTADAIANYFLDSKIGHVTQLQIQKLVYISHGIYMAIHDKPLIGEPVEAWKFGPVIPSLRKEFREFGASPITRFATKPMRNSHGQIVQARPTVDDENPELAKSVEYVLNQVDRIYGHMSGPQLSTLTHQKGSPWHTIYQDTYNGNPPFGEQIPNELITSHYKKLLEGFK